MKYAIWGFILLTIGGSTADGKLPLLSAFVAITGALLILIGSKEIEEEEGEE